MRIVLSDFMSLDGVVQAPGGREEDTDGGFAHGGWSIPFFEPETMGPAVNDVMAGTEALLFGGLLPAPDALGAIGAIRALRAQDGQAMQVMGSASLAAQLIERDLVDEYRLMIEPILLGGGKPVFPDDGRARALELVSTTATGTGVLSCTDRPA